ncbi:Uroporphyrinogen III decarboxylase (EC 4.1.1.37) [Candidatus Phaeomarinobacter ectocarpi]|uniref:Uroporphyrinogen decarboxylase n=2 Tax=Candidatus Phaeomarinibacter ectocarpi TaxID=1458461 RepID=X5MN45_9HYPH|nr:Uroporphyrinogen III decarboxylase (EC 4.1.1.37) [Candidatus Phaeomarinobacter ectocarpi]
MSPPPVWLMRQAGRYLPEYRETREKAGGFLDLCFDPKLASEVTLQPIRRYGFDASILFADILLIPQALGQKLWFETGEGPRLEPLEDGKAVAALDVDGAADALSSIYETVSILRSSLPGETDLIGFAGSPWTVATYMIAGRGTPDQAPARLFAYQQRDAFEALMDVLVESTAQYLLRQVQAGADILQLFDTWSGVLPEDEFARWSIAPTKALVERLRALGVTVPIIGFPKGAGPLLPRYVAETAVDAVGLDPSVPLSWAVAELADKTVCQGNLDPLLLVAGGDKMLKAVDTIIEAFDGKPFVFNLGHGIVPQTPPEHVGQVVERVRNR